MSPAHRLYQKGSGESANTGCAAQVLSFWGTIALFDVFFPDTNFFVAVFTATVVSIALFVVVALAAQKFWDDQWKDSCITRSGQIKI